ncbi:unnamed protein product, partial [Gulo gulo]
AQPSITVHIGRKDGAACGVQPSAERHRSAGPVLAVGTPWTLNSISLLSGTWKEDLSVLLFPSGGSPAEKD